MSSRLNVGAIGLEDWGVCMRRTWRSASQRAASGRADQKPELAEGFAGNSAFPDGIRATRICCR